MGCLVPSAVSNILYITASQLKSKHHFLIKAVCGPNKWHQAAFWTHTFLNAICNFLSQAFMWNFVFLKLFFVCFSCCLGTLWLKQHPLSFSLQCRYTVCVFSRVILRVIPASRPDRCLWACNRQVCSRFTLLTFCPSCTHLLMPPHTESRQQDVDF